MRLLPLALVVLAAGCAAPKSTETAAAPEAAPAPAPRDPAAEQAAWMKYMTPGEEHARLAKSVGTWDYVSKFWMDPSQEAQTSKGVSTFTTIHNGLFVRMEVDGEMMGMPFKGMSINGFDNVTKEYMSFWVDSMGSGMVLFKGKSDEKGALHMSGPMVDPMGGPPVTMRTVTSEINPDTMVFEMWCAPPGQPEMKCMEMTYTRRK